MTEILPGVYVGNHDTARDATFFAEKNIRRVVNCTPDIPFYFPTATYYRIPVYDANTEWNNRRMINGLPLALTFILDPVPNVNDGVLIHCHAGISRSCTVAVALLRLCCARSLRHAISLCVSRRPIAFFGGLVFNFRPALEALFAPDTIEGNNPTGHGQESPTP